MIFVDSNIFISYYNKDDSNHKSAVKLIKDIEDGKYGNPFTSDYVFSEVMTVCLMKIKNRKKVLKLGYYLLSGKIKIVKIDKGIFKKAWQLFQKSKLKMSFTDFTNLAILELLKIKNIATFDREFNKIKNIKVMGN